MHRYYGVPMSGGKSCDNQAELVDPDEGYMYPFTVTVVSTSVNRLVPKRLYLQTLCEVEIGAEVQIWEGVDGTGSVGVTVKKGVAKCPHNLQRNRFKPCGGSGICEHNCQRNRCKPCDGSCIFEHNHRMSEYKQCGGSSICEHNRRRRRCK